MGQHTYHWQTSQTIDSRTTVGTVSEVEEEFQLSGDVDNIMSATVIS